MSSLKMRPRLVRLLYNHNPFYVISAVLMLSAVRSMYGELEIGAINCWIMMGVLAAYTTLLAAIGVLIVRWGKVWEDARSILLLLLLLFLAVSISADDLFANREGDGAASVLLPLCGFLFSALVTELVLRGARIRLGLRYRVPLHLMYALFYAAPWACSSALAIGSPATVAWRIVLFPVAAGIILLTLLPAVHAGPRYVADNGTPWGWPHFPWTAFGVIVVAVAMRTFALSMTFGPTGPIWVPLSSGRLAISFDTMWGPYFLLPVALVVLLLWLEAGLVAGNVGTVRKALLFAPFTLLLAVPLFGGPVFYGFLNEFTATLGSPLRLTVWALIGYYGWSWLRGAAAGEIGALGSISLLSVVGPNTTGPLTLIDPLAWPLVIVGTVLLGRGVMRKSSAWCLLSSAVLTVVLWLALPETPLAGFRMTVCFHALWGAAITMGLAFSDSVGRVLRFVGAVQMPIAAVLATVGPGADAVPITWSTLYVLVLAVVCLGIAQYFHSRWYLYAFTSLLTIAVYGGALFGFREAVRTFGTAGTTSFLWSVGALITAILISAHKAGWMPARLFPRWSNGHGMPEPPAQ